MMCKIAIIIKVKLFELYKINLEKKGYYIIYSLYQNITSWKQCLLIL